MKRKRIYSFIGLMSVSLITLLAIQLTWIYKTAAIKEELFREKANSVLSKTAEAIGRDEKTCRDIANCPGQADISTIDSVLRRYMAYYNIHLSYRFEIIRPSSGATQNIGGGPYLSPIPGEAWKADPGQHFTQSLEEIVRRKGVGLTLSFPDRQQYMLAEMGPLFATSVILILLVLVVSWRAVWSLAKEKQLMEQSTDFLNNMTHEFKTPITNMALAGKMVLKNASQENNVQHYTGMMLQENEKLKQQVDLVLSMMALERGEIPLQKENVSVHQIIAEALLRLKLQIEARQAHVELKLDAIPDTISGDKTQLLHVFMNLIDNALKYSTSAPQISIRTSAGAKGLLINVEDSGIGIEHKYHHDIFKKYMRVPAGDMHNVKGFGLGLAYVKTIVELHHGQISVQSEPGKGSIFSLTLPYA